MVNFMVDLETMSTASNAVILTIGCIPFGSDGSLIVEEDMFFYNRIDLSSYNNRPEFHSDFNTLLWWLQQEKEPLDEAFLAGPRKPIDRAMMDFDIWLAQICSYLNDKKITMWSHGKDFDCVVLDNAFKACHLECPWKYFDTRDTRTIYSLAGVDMRNVQIPEGYKAHNAIGDCLKQIEGIKQSFQIINNVRNQGHKNHSSDNHGSSDNEIRKKRKSE